MAPIPVCAGCGRDSVPSGRVLCVHCTAILATSTPIRWAAPTAAVPTVPTLLQPTIGGDRG